MIQPVAKRLRELLEEVPGRSAYSLLITGHSAGGAVAALLYSHMLSVSKGAESELTRLAGRFRRIHCVTFGAPPVSLLPLQKPDDEESRSRLRKSLFLSFINEGDPVARADKAYVKSLLELFAAPAPSTAATGTGCSQGTGESQGSVEARHRTPKSKLSMASLSSSKNSKSGKTSSKYSSSSSNKIPRPRPIWTVPPSTLSNAGRIIVLRSGDLKVRRRDNRTIEELLNEGVVAHIATDEQLRGVIWGDPVAHVMKLYSGRIETLAVGAVTVKGY
jgi:hypothetical protein